jgi:hypothetical protein
MRIAPAVLAAVIGMGLFLALTPAQASAAATPTQPAESGQSVAVRATGSVPDLAPEDLPGFVAATLNASHPDRWHFEVAGPGVAVPGYRIDWRFKRNAYAAGTVRSYGFSRAQMERLVGSRNSLTIEARLFLKGQYQTLVLESVTLTEGARSPKLAEKIVKIARELMAYPDLDTKSGAPARPSGS